MAKKKNRAFFVCPRWNELPHVSDIDTAKPRISAKILTTIKEGRPVARSTLRKALEAVRIVSGANFDIDAYIVDRRAVAPE